MLKLLSEYTNLHSNVAKGNYYRESRLQNMLQINKALKIQNQLFSLTSSERCFFDNFSSDASLDVRLNI